MSRSLGCGVKEMRPVSKSLSSYGVKQMGIITPWPKQSPEVSSCGVNEMGEVSRSLGSVCKGDGDNDRVAEPVSRGEGSAANMIKN